MITTIINILFLIACVNAFCILYYTIVLIKRKSYLAFASVIVFVLCVLCIKAQYDIFRVASKERHYGNRTN
jgi:membrane protein YdbS with pleckstrin-like domain